MSPLSSTTDCMSHGSVLIFIRLSGIVYCLSFQPESRGLGLTFKRDYGLNGHFENSSRLRLRVPDRAP